MPTLNGKPDNSPPNFGLFSETKNKPSTIAIEMNLLIMISVIENPKCYNNSIISLKHTKAEILSHT